MKKILILFLALFLTIKLSYSQYDGNFRLGLKAAPSIGWIKAKSDTIEADGTHIGFSFGLISEFVLADNYSFATGFDIASIGGKSKYTKIKPTELIYDEYKLKYLEIPLTLKMKTNQVNAASFYGQIGLGLGFNLGAKSDQKVTDINNVEISGRSKTNLDVKKDINFVRASLIIGGGTEIAIMGNTALLLGFTFNNGFLNMFSSNNTNEKNAINNYIALNIGILF